MKNVKTEKCERRWRNISINNTGENKHLITPFELHELKSALKECKNISAPG